MTTDKQKLEELLLCVEDVLGHELEPYKIARSSRLSKLRELSKKFGGPELKSKAFWDHVKRASDEVKTWPAWKRGAMK